MSQLRLPLLAACVSLLFWVASCGTETGIDDVVVPPPVDSAVPPPPPPVAPSTAPVAFTSASVVPMTSEQILTDQTVVVEDGRILAIGPTGSVIVPAGAQVIDATGRYLMPGLADVHTHVSVITSFQHVPDPDQAEQQGILLVANGVTTVLNMGDYERHDLIELRNRWVTREALGPRMFVGKFVRGPQDSGTSHEIAATAATARSHVDRAWSLDYDFVKTYSRLGTDVQAAAIAQARQRGLPVFGHLPLSQDLVSALGGGLQMVAHVAQYFSTHYGGQTDGSLTPSAITTSLQNDTWVATTLTASESFRAAWGNNQAGFDAMLQRPGVVNTHPEIIQRWRFWLGQGTTPNQLDFQMPFLLGMTNDFRAGGVELLLGTDAPELPGLASGFAVHRELELLVDAGLTPFQALAAGTETVGRFIAEFFPAEAPSGTVEVGSRADLILLNSDPLASVTATTDRAGVMVGGVWYEQGTLDAQLDSLRALYGH